MGDGIDNDAPNNVLDNREAQSQALSESGAVAAKLAEETPATQTDTAAPADAAAAQTEDVAPEVSAAENAKIVDSAAPAEAPENSQAADSAPQNAQSAEPPATATAPGINAPGETRTQSSPLVAQPRPEADGTPSALAKPAPYKNRCPTAAPNRASSNCRRPSTMSARATGWRRGALRVFFPRDEIQFERASIYYNGGKAFNVPLYVLPLDGSFNPTTDIFSFNSQGGLSVKFPIFYQASKGGTGALIVRQRTRRRVQFGAQRAHRSKSISNTRCRPVRAGRLGIDQIGNGSPNLNFQHQQTLGSSSVASFFLNVPRGRDIFGRAAITKDFKKAQIGLEAFL